MLLKLSGEWKLKNDEYAITGHVPGDVTDDFLQAGIIKDPYFHDNYKQSLWITKSDWVYEKTFVINENELDAYTYIKFEGVDTFSDVFLNGTLIGKTANMHRIYCFPVNGLLRDGENLLSVHLHNVFDAMGAQEQEKYESIFCANRIFVRKAQCHFGWDWAPRFPGYGIYRDVTLISEKKAATESVAVETALSGDVTFRIAFREKFVGNLEVKILHEGKCVAEKKLPVACKKMLTNLRVEKPKLWWPNGYGQQPIYEYVVCQHFEDGIQECHGIFGFRRVEIDRSVLDGDNLGFAVQVNGRKIFCRGSNWVPAECMTGRLRDEKYEQLSYVIDLQSFIDYFSINVYLCNTNMNEIENYLLWRTIEPENGEYGDTKWRWIIYDVEPIESLRLEYYGFDARAEINTFTHPQDWTGFIMNENSIFQGLKECEPFRKQFVLTFLDIANVNFAP